MFPDVAVCGSPTGLQLNEAGFDVTIGDNLSRRYIEKESEVSSLTPIQAMSTRIAAWREIFGKTIDFVNIDTAVKYYRLLTLIEELQPTTSFISPSSETHRIR